MANVGRESPGRRGSEGEAEFLEKVVAINRVAKVVKGGRRFGFTALVVVGDGQGRVGMYLGKANEVADAIRKGTEGARKRMVRVPLYGTTVPCAMETAFGAARVVIRPAGPGTGVIAGTAMRAILECAGIKDVLAKSLGTANALNVAAATMKALEDISAVLEASALRGGTDAAS